MSILELHFLDFGQLLNEHVSLTISSDIQPILKFLASYNVANACPVITSTFCLLGISDCSFPFEDLIRLTSAN